MAENTVQVGSGKSKHLLRRFFTGPGVIVLVVVVALAAGAGVRWWQQKNAQDQLPEPESIAEEASNAQGLALRGDNDAALQAIGGALENPNLSQKAKYDLYMQQGVTYEAQKNYPAAMESFRKAEAINLTMDVAQCIARIAQEQGEKQVAIEYYTKAIQLVPADDPMAESLKRYFQNSITVLEGGEPSYE